jgi:hypothetical protein
VAANRNSGIGLPKRPLLAPQASLTGAPSLGTVGRFDQGHGKPSRTKRSSNAGPTSRHVSGYPASWPAGPWVVPLFWLTVLALVLLLWFLG